MMTYTTMRAMRDMNWNEYPEISAEQLMWSAQCRYQEMTCQEEERYTKCLVDTWMVIEPNLDDG